jgi:heme exporter protein A
MLTLSKVVGQRGGRQLFDDLSFELSPGQLMYVVGANGAGKTSLLRMICGLARPESGTVLWNAAAIEEDLQAFSADLLFIGHHPAIKPELTAKENLVYFLGTCGYPYDPEKTRKALNLVGLKGKLHTPARFLSQGQLRRLALARLWLESKKLWVLDEPYTALDADGVRIVEARMSEHLAQGGMIVMTSHQQPTLPQALVRQISL